MTLPSVPVTPRTWSPGNWIAAPRMRAEVANTVAFLSNRPYFAGQSNAGSSWGSGADNTLGLNEELTDPWNMHDFYGVVANSVSSQIWCQAPGWYLAHSTVAWNYTSSTQAPFAAGFQWRNNGAATTAATRGGILLNGSTHPLAAQSTDLIPQTVTGPIGGSGDFIQCTAFQNTGSNVNLLASATLQPSVSVRWVCALTGTQPLPVPPLATAPSPLTSAWMNANVRDTISFLSYPPICKVTLGTGHTLTSSTFPAGFFVPFDTVTVDNYGGFSTGSSAVYTAPVSGRYYVYGQFNLAAASSTAAYGAGIIVNNGTTMWGDVVEKVSDTFGGGATVGKRIRLNAGDTVGLVSTQNSGSTISFSSTAANQTRMVIVWEGI